MRLSIAPMHARLDEAMAIQVSEAPPGATVRLRVRNHTLKAESVADFVAPANGIVDVTTHAPVAGDYEGVEPAGLFWSARFDDGVDAATMIGALSSLKPIDYTATASSGGSESAVDFSRVLLAPNIVQTPVRDGRLRGTLFAPSGASRSPAAVVLGGSDGGNLYTFVAALLAAHGITALSLAYFAHEDLPQNMIEIPVEYFADAVRWLGARPEVGGSRVGILGFSRGAEAALLTGANTPEIGAVVALAPGSLTGGGIAGADLSAMGKPAWTLNGAPTPLLPPPWDPVSMKEAQTAFMSGRPLAAMPGILRALESAGGGIDAVAIPVERIRGPILLMSGEDDQLWPSARFAEIAVQRLEAAGFSYPFEHLRYPDAGHFAVLPPNLPARTDVARHPLVPMALAFGGTPRGNAAASADLWPRIVAFLRRHL